MILLRSTSIERFQFAIAILLVIVCNTAKAHEDPTAQINEITKAITEDPDDPNLYLRRGALFIDVQSYKKAESDYKRAAQLDPSDPAIDLARGKLYWEMGNLVLAKENLDRLLSKQPQNADGRTLRARVLFARHDVESALSDYDAALKIAPDPDMYVERANAEESNSDASRALNGLDEGIQRLGPVPTLQFPAIELEMKLKHFDRALARLNTLQPQFERKENYYEQKGRILDAQGKKVEARAAYREALKLLHSQPDYLKNTAAGKAFESELKEKITVDK